MAIERLKAWECVGCGKIDAPQPCIGVCRDRKVELVYGSEYDAVVARMGSLEAIVKTIARTTPRAGEWERSWRALQEQARQALG